MRAVAAAVLTIAALGWAPPVANAECLDFPIAANETMHANFVFEATVTEASTNVDPSKPDNAPYDWHVSLAVTRTYRGEVAATFVYDGWNQGCSMLRGDHLVTGQHLLISTAQIGYGGSGDDTYKYDDPFWHDVLVWEKTASVWSFFSGGLMDGESAAYYPAAARTASTIGAILDALNVMPDTVTAPELREAPPPPDLTWAFLLFGGVAGIWWFRRSAHLRVADR